MKEELIDAPTYRLKCVLFINELLHSPSRTDLRTPHQNISAGQLNVHARVCRKRVSRAATKRGRAPCSVAVTSRKVCRKKRVNRRTSDKRFRLISCSFRFRLLSTQIVYVEVTEYLLAVRFGLGVGVHELR